MHTVSLAITVGSADEVHGLRGTTAEVNVGSQDTSIEDVSGDALASAVI